MSWSQTTVELGADDWCPFTCDPKQAPGAGIISDVVESALDKSDFKFKYKFLNWARAVDLAEKNEIYGVLGAYKSDLPHFKFTNKPISVSRDCFYSTGKTKWVFKNLKSLENQKVGYINGYGYGQEIDEAIKNPQFSKIFSPVSGDSPLEQNLKKILDNRITVLIENQMVINFKKSVQPEFKKLKEVGCLQPKEIFAAINPKAENGQKVIDLLNDYLNQPDSSKKIKRIEAKYIRSNNNSN